jgi:hypothetical protein
MKKKIALACVALSVAMMPTLAFSEQPYRDNHGHHTVYAPPRHVYHPHHYHRTVNVSHPRGH